MRLYQLDGLRAVALVMVVLIHHGLLRSGWAGVDVFFVLSGYLITGILRRESGKPRFWESFYTKRAARILPPLLVLFAVAMVIAGSFKIAYLGYIFFAGNFLQLSHDHLDIMGPLWSLAIEEHFYFLWPLAVRYLRRGTLLRLSITIVMVSPFLRILGTLAFRHIGYTTTGWDNPIFLLTPFRIDGLAAGSALALLTEEGACPAFLSRWSGTMSLAASATFLVWEFADKSFRRTTDSLLFNGFGYSLIVTAAFFLVSFLLSKPQSALARLLTIRPAVFIGTISYSFYIYQEGVILAVRSFVGMHVSLKLLFVPDFLLTAMLATASFYLIEKPIMARGKEWLKQRRAKQREEQKEGSEESVDYAVNQEIST